MSQHITWRDFVSAWKAVPSMCMQTLRNMRDAPLYLWIINLLYLGILIIWAGSWISWIANGEEVSEFIGNVKGMSIFLMIFAFIAYRLAWDWVLIKFKYMPPYDER